MPENQRAPRADVVDVFITIGVPDVGTIAAFDEAGLSADRTECPNRRIHASGNDLLSSVEKFFGPGHSALRKPSQLLG
jgi:hypothetical protein